VRPHQDDPAGTNDRGTEEPRPADPVTGDGGALRAGASSTPPSAVPPAGGASEESPSGQSDADQVQQDFEALLAEAREQKDEYLELARRTQADFENFRKRMSAEVQAAGVRGKSDLIREMVPALDDLERALQAAGLDPEGDSEDGLAHGVLLVFRSLRETLQRNGVEAVDPQGEKFDPQWHEALSTATVEGVEPGTVVEVMQKGYKLGEQLVRPARVVVSE
jgi:molecular chaperone GrpE